jgi:hypothetical protein
MKIPSSYKENIGVRRTVSKGVDYGVAGEPPLKRLQSRFRVAGPQGGKGWAWLKLEGVYGHPSP